MIDFEGDSFHTHEQAVALIATFYKASYRKLLGLVRKRFRSLEAEDMVEELFVKILAQVDESADDPGALGSLMEKWITPAYVFSSLIYLCLDAVGSGPARWEDATDPQDGTRRRAARTSAWIPPTSTGSATFSSPSRQACTHAPRTKSPPT